jgi:hypothetical protein
MVSVLPVLSLTDAVPDLFAPTSVIRDPMPMPRPIIWLLALPPVKEVIAMTQIVGIRTTSINMVPAMPKAAENDGSDAMSVPTILAVSVVPTIQELPHSMKWVCF